MFRGDFDGERLEEQRKDKGYTQKQLADMIGVSEGSVSSYERNVMAPLTENLIKIAEILDISIDYLCGLTDDELPANRENFIALPKEYPIELKKDLLDYLQYLKAKYKV